MASIPKVDADAKIKPDKTKVEKQDVKEQHEEPTDEESSESESEDEGEDGKKKRVKEKVGFRDRKVNYK